MTDLDALEAVARAATPGEWEPYQVHHTRSEAGYCAVEVGDTEVRIARFEGGWFDAEHIATFDPPTVLALIAKLREAEAVSTKLAAAAGRARALHKPTEALNVRYGRKQQVCTGCGTDDGNWQTWPCPTIRALSVPEVRSDADA